MNRPARRRRNLSCTVRIHCLRTFLDAQGNRRLRDIQTPCGVDEIASRDDFQKGFSQNDIHEERYEFLII